MVLTSKVPSFNDPNLMVGETASTNEALKLQKDWSRKFCCQKEHSSQSSSRGDIETETRPHRATQREPHAKWRNPQKKYG